MLQPDWLNYTCYLFYEDGGVLVRSKTACGCKQNEKRYKPVVFISFERLADLKQRIRSFALDLYT